jgi:hypothetical protein
MHSLSRPWLRSAVRISKPERSRSECVRSFICCRYNERTPTSLSSRPDLISVSVTCVMIAASTSFWINPLTSASLPGIPSVSRNKTLQLKKKIRKKLWEEDDRVDTVPRIHGSCQPAGTNILTRRSRVNHVQLNREVCQGEASLSNAIRAAAKPI